MTGTAAEIKSVTEVDDKVIGNGEPGKITRQLQKAFKKVALGKDDSFSNWLTYI